MNGNYLTNIKYLKINREILIWWITTLRYVAFDFEHYLMKYYMIYSAKL